MNTTFAIVLLAVSALLGVAYLLALNKLSSGLVSSYPKADANKRLGAAMVDGLLCATCVLAGATTTSAPLLIVAAAYVLLRDGAIRGQSPGKLLFGLTVIEIDSGRSCTLSRSIQRNILFLIPGFNLVAVVLEAFAYRRDPQGQRLGDKIAQTQVVVGKDAKELTKLLQQRLLDGIADVGSERNRRRKPAAEKV